MNKNQKLRKLQNDAALEWYQNKTNANAERVVELYQPFLYWLANKKSKALRGYFSPDEIYCEAVHGLWVALTKYNGIADFSNYATYWILAKIQRSIQKNRSAVNFGYSSSRRKLLGIYDKIMEQMRFDQPDKTIDEIHQQIADEFDLKLSDVELIYFEKQGVRSLDKPMVGRDGENSPLNDLIPDPETVDIEDRLNLRLDGQFMKKRIDNFFKKLTPRESDILWNSLLQDNDTYQVIGDRYGVSRERIRQQRDVLKQKLERFKEVI